MATPPVIEAADCISNGNNANTANPGLTFPAHTTGALLIQAITSDADLNITPPANGPNGETLNIITNNAEPGGTGGPHFSVAYWVATNNTNSANLTWTISGAGEQWAGLSIHVPANEFNANSPIGTVSSVGSNATNSAAAVMPAFTANEADGRIVYVVGMDQVTSNGSANGWTLVESLDIGSVGIAAHVRNNGTTANENVSATNFAMTANDSYVGVAFVVKAPPDAAANAAVNQTLGELTPTITADVEQFFELYATANIPANANTATTAQLTAPANKTSNDFTAGLISDDTNPLPSVNIAANQYTELEWSVVASNAVTTNHVYTFRVTANGTELDTYSANATWTIGEGTVTSNGVVNATLDAVAITETTATVSVSAASDTALASATLDATGTVAVVAGVQQTLADAGLSAAATVSSITSVAQTLGTITEESTATVSVSAATDAALGEIAVASTATVTESGAVSAIVEQALEAIAEAADATVAITAIAADTLGVLSPTATATVPVSSAVSQSLGAVTLAATAADSVSGAASLTLASLSATATATVAVKAAVAQTLNNVGIVATAAQGTGTPFVLSASANIAANAATATTGQLTPPANKTVVADFQAGRISDDTNPLPSTDLVANRYTELEWSLRSAGTVNTATYSFRVTANGTALSNYAVTPTWYALNAINAAANTALGDLAITSTANVSVVGASNAAVNQTLAEVAPTATAAVAVNAAVNTTLASATISANAAVSVSAAVNTTLNSLSLSATTVGSGAWVDSTLGELSNPKLHCDGSPLGGGTPTGWNFYFRRPGEGYTYTIPIAYDPDLEIRLVTIAPDFGEWYVMIKAYNDGGESDASNEVFVVVPRCTATVAWSAGMAYVSQQLGTVSQTSAAKVAVRPSLTQTLAVASLAGAATVAVKSATSQTLAVVAASGAAKVGVAAAVDATLGSVACSASALVYAPDVNAEVAQTLAAVAITATASVTTAGTRVGAVAQTLQVVQSSATATVSVSADVATTLDAVAVASTAAVTDPGNPVGTVNTTLGNITATTGVTVDIDTLLEEILGEVTCHATARVGCAPYPGTNLLYDGSELLCRS